MPCGKAQVRMPVSRVARTARKSTARGTGAVKCVAAMPACIPRAYAILPCGARRETAARRWKRDIGFLFGGARLVVSRRQALWGNGSYAILPGESPARLPGAACDLRMGPVLAESQTTGHRRESDFCKSIGNALHEGENPSIRVAGPILRKAARLQQRISMLGHCQAGM